VVGKIFKGYRDIVDVGTGNYRRACVHNVNIVVCFCGKLNAADGEKDYKHGCDYTYPFVVVPEIIKPFVKLCFLEFAHYITAFILLSHIVAHTYEYFKIIMIEFRFK
jgi:hypothetical protein